MSTWPPLILPDDSPLDEDGRRRYSEYRLEPVIVALHAVLDAWVSTPKRLRSVPPRIGLFGGLGQGKSSVVRCVLESLESRQSWRQRAMAWMWGLRIARFNVSYFKTDDLEWRFLTAVLWQRVRRNLLPGLLLSFAVLAVVVSNGALSIWWDYRQCSADWALCGKWLLGVWSGLILSMALILPMIRRIGAIFGKAKSLDPAGGIYLARRDLLIQSFARFMLALPDVVVVDDLDRACIEQQRGFLRAVARFSQELGFAVVVCMDESELLVAPPNPEAPEEFLRKNLTVELRLPDRSREDAALLAMSCVREIAGANSGHPLIPALMSVQFVADLIRTLLLNRIASPFSPRKVQRQVARVALHACQLKICSADDLAALLRIDELLQLAPSLRRHMDGLRQVLESNHVSGLSALMIAANVPETHRQQVERFFNRTRMMQPALRDGWFRLLGGFASNNDQAHPKNGTQSWQAEWKIASRSHDFFRLYLEAIELDAVGYEHELVLSIENVTSATRYKFELPGGKDVVFDMEELPPDFLGLKGGYFAQCWVLWVCALADSAPSHKPALYERAIRWFASSSKSTTDLRSLFWRECMADAEFWNDLDTGARREWWQRVRIVANAKDAQGTPHLEIDRFFAIPLLHDDFADAWSILARPGNEVRDGRKALHWLRGLTPEIQVDKLPPATDVITLFSKIWPAPVPELHNATGWHEVLEKHFIALNAVNAVKKQIPVIPAPLHYAWRRAQIFLDKEQCLDILYRLACDMNAPRGMRWSTRAIEPWLELFEKRAVLEALKARAESSSVVAGDDRQPARQLMILLLSGMRGWVPGNIKSSFDGLPEDEIQEIFQVLSDRGIAPDWWPRYD